MLRPQSNRSQVLRRQLLALLVATGVCEVAGGEDSLQLTAPAQSPVKLEILGATRTWDESNPEPSQTPVRFRPAAAKTPTKSVLVETSAPPLASGVESEGVLEMRIIPEQAAVPKKVQVLSPTKASTKATDDSWVARDAVNSREPLRDPSSPAPLVSPAPLAPTVKLSQPELISPPTRFVPKVSRLPERPKAEPPQLTPTPSILLDSPAGKGPALAAPTQTQPSGELGRVGDAAENSLQLVEPSELKPLRRLKSHLSSEPAAASVDELPVGDSGDDALTAVDMMLGPATSDVKSPSPSAGALSNDGCGEESNSPRGGMAFRRLQIERDGTPTSSINSRQPTRTTRDAEPLLKEIATAPTSVDGNNEPSKREAVIDDVVVSPSFGADESARLGEVPGSSARVVPPSRDQVDRDYTGQPVAPIQVSSAVARLQPAMRSCLSYYHGTPEDATGRSNWGMMHQIMVYGVDTNITAGRSTYNAIAWIAGNNACRGQRILGKGPRGIEARNGVGLQGHQGQLLAVMSLCAVPGSYPVYVGRERFSVDDLVREEMATCKSGEELTFTLIGLSHYLSTAEQWRSADGQTWDFERLIREELSQPIVGAACGGTHRLMGLAHALRHRREEGLEVSGQWLRAEKFLDDFVTYTYQLQNRDGSMSTSWFEKPEDNGNMDRKVQTTGHMVEWLLTYTADEDLQNPRLVAAIRFLLGAMNGQRDHDWQIGPKGHALRSLAMYYDRVYKAGPAWSGAPAMARSTKQSRR